MIVAAGAGRRMGGVNKALLRWGETSFLQSLNDSLLRAGVEEVVVICASPHGAETAAHARSLGLTCVANPQPEIGMAGSVSLGFAHALEAFEADTCFLWPVDAPGVRAQTLRQLVERGDRGGIVTPSYEGRGGHPSLVGRSVWEELSRCSSEPEGARSVFRRSGERRTYVDVSDRAVIHDVDRPSDLSALEQL